MIRKTLGGERLGSGRRIKVSMHEYERSTHDLSYIWRSSMSSGTLVPFMSKVGLPGDTFDIGLGCEILTHPTLGPLFGTYKVQLDVFMAPVRLYQAELHNNRSYIGLNMDTVPLPQLGFYVGSPTAVNDNAQINPSCIFSYLGIRGVGVSSVGNETIERDFNAIPYLAYWDIYKNYYANQQEKIGCVINNPRTAITNTITTIQIRSVSGGSAITIPNTPSQAALTVIQTSQLTINWSGTIPKLSEIKLVTETGNYSPDEMFAYVSHGSPITLGQPKFTSNIFSWQYITLNSPITVSPRIQTFPLENLDTMRERILQHPANSAAFTIDRNTNLSPYHLPFQILNTSWLSAMQNSQEGLAIKTYNSDLFNNWLRTEWIDGPGGIAEVTAIDTSSGSFTIDTLNIAEKVYKMKNRIAASGGSYNDWLETTWTNGRLNMVETPVYYGGLIKELVFQEVVGNSASETQASGTQPLGTLAGRGKMGEKHKGGHITIKPQEPCYIIGIISLTPRIDYSQGNSWDNNLKTMDDFHKPELDQIGFQDLITDQMAWWDTKVSPAGLPIYKSAGKQPAWINYMTSVNEVRGNFAMPDNEMFMTLNRRYGYTANGGGTIADLTTYIDPAKFNFIFADTALDAQNFWAQIKIDITARRKMSAKLMPNL